MSALTERKPAKPRGKRIVAWLLVDRHGYPDAVYGPGLSTPAKERAEKAARRMNDCAPSTDSEKFGPWMPLRIEFYLPAKRRAK